MRRRSFRRGPRKSWAWSCDKSFTTLSALTGSANSAWLLPPGRVKYMTEAASKRSLVVDRILLWLNPFLEQNANAGNAPPTYVDSWIIKSSTDAGGNIDTDYAPFEEPEAPSTLTAWDTNPEDDGLDQFAWTHRWWLPGYNQNQSFVSNPGAGAAYAFQGFNPQKQTFSANGQFLFVGGQVVKALCHPDLDIRVKRRLNRSEGLAIGSAMPGCGTATNDFGFTLAYTARILCHVA